MEYLSLDLRVSGWDAPSRSAVVEVFQSPVGEVPGRRLRLDLGAAGQSGRDSMDEPSAQRFGSHLWQSIFVDDIRDTWLMSYQNARDRRRRLRLRLHIEDPELTQVPWELLYDPRQQEFLVYDHNISLVRYTRLPNRPPEMIEAGKITILVVVPSPIDAPALDWAKEVRLLRKALADLIANKRVELALCAHASPQRLQDMLMETRPEVVHYIGHGEYDQRRKVGSLILEDGGGRSVRLEARDVARMLRRYGTRLVFLNACDTARGPKMGLAAALLRAEIPAVVAMQWPVEDSAAMNFSRAFYRALSFDMTVDECTAQGRLSVASQGGGPPDWAAPVLFLRATSGHLWYRDTDQTAPKKKIEITAQASKTPEQARRPIAKPLFVTKRALQPEKDGNLIAQRPELDRVLKIVRQPSVSQYVAIIGPKHSGKTTFLHQIQSQLSSRQPCTYIDLALLNQQDLIACLRFLAYEIGSELEETLDQLRAGPRIRRRTRGVTLVGRSPLVAELEQRGAVEVDSVAGFYSFLAALAKAAPVPRIVVLVDQVGTLAPEVSAGFFGTLRSVFIQGRRHGGPLAKYLFIFAGTIDLQSLIGGRNSPLNICDRIYLRDLDELQTAQILGQFTRVGATVDEHAAGILYRATSGQPYLTMRLCELMQQQGARRIESSAIQDAIKTLLNEDPYMAHLERHLRASITARGVVRRILDGQELRFTRAVPELAALEMIGFIADTSPTSFRSEIHGILAQRVIETPNSNGEYPAMTVSQQTSYDCINGLCRLADAVDESQGSGDGAWRRFAAGLYSQVPEFSVLPSSSLDHIPWSMHIQIDKDASLQAWGRFRPGALAACRSLDHYTREQVIDELYSRAGTLRLTLVFVMTYGGADPHKAGTLSGRYRETLFVQLPREQVIDTLRSSRSIDLFLRDRVRQSVRRHL